MTLWYDRQGRPLVTADSGTPEWLTQMKKVEELLGDPKYRRVAEDTLPDGKWVSTVWLGVDHSMGGKNPLIFETMVFPKMGDFHELEMKRYSTLAEAKKGHKEMVKGWSWTN